jgi:hypothetical protein
MPAPDGWNIRFGRIFDENYYSPWRDGVSGVFLISKG